MIRQRHHSTSPWLLRASAHVLSVAVLGLPAQALAQWQSIHPVLPSNYVDGCIAPVLRATENRPLRVAAGSSYEIEVLGHGIDLTRDFAFDGGTVNWRRSYGGVANIKRDCGAIGSVKLQLNVPTVNPPTAAAAERNFPLRIGNQTIPVTVILPVRLEAKGWHPASIRQEPARQGTSSGGGSGGLPQSRMTTSSGPSCQETQTCGSGTGVVFLGQSFGSTNSSPADVEPLDSLAACILGRGGDVRQVDGRLEITLPDDRADARNCITWPSFLEISQEYERPDLWQTESQSPPIRYSLNAGSDAFLSASSVRSQSAFYIRDRVRFTLARDFALNMVGVRNFRITATNFVGRSVGFDIRVQSVVPYGVTQIAPATMLANTGSIGASRFDTAPAPSAATLVFNIDLAPSDATARLLRWELRDHQGRVDPDLARCFTATTGTINPAPGVNRVSLTLERSSPTTCVGKLLSVQVAPATRSGTILYTRTTAVTLN